MMHLAINYSPAAARLVGSGQIEFDYFKTPDWTWLVNEASRIKPVAVHFTLEAGNDNLGKIDWENISELAQATHTPFINIHLDSKQSHYPGYSLDTTDSSAVEIVYKVIYSDVMKVIDRFEPERVIIENSPYQGREGNTLQLCVMPDLIKRLVQDTGCGLLLDISHAVITARHLGIDEGEYISQLPIDRIKELHFAGIHHNPTTGGWMDHLSIQDEDWYWLDWALGLIHRGEWSHPWLLAFEYGGVGDQFEWRSNEEVISAQVPDLYERIKFLND